MEVKGRGLELWTGETKDRQYTQKTGDQAWGSSICWQEAWEGRKGEGRGGGVEGGSTPYPGPLHPVSF